MAQEESYKNKEPSQTEEAPSQLEKLFGVKPKKMEPLAEKTQKALRILSLRVDQNVRAGEEYTKTSTFPWGRVPLPGERGGEKYYRVIKHRCR